MSEWQEVTIGGICKRVVSGGTPLTSEHEYYLDGNIPWLKTKEVNQCRIYATENHITQLGLENSSAKLIPINSVTVAMYGDGQTAGRVGLTKIPLATNQACCNLIIDENIADAEFVFYHLFGSYDELVARKTGSGQQNLNAQLIKAFGIPLPALPEQKAIAAVLSSLDDKIDLLHRQNKTLESMAATLFRQWFVEEAQEDWEFVELGKYVNCFNGVSYKSEDLNPSTTAMVTLKSFDRDGGFRLDGFKEFTGKYKEQHVVTQGDLVVAHTDITQDAEVIGNPVLVVSNPAYGKLVISMDLVKVTSKYEWLSNEFLYRMMRTREFKQHCLGYSNGSTVLHLNKEAIPSYEFFLPPKERIEEFTRLAKGLLGKKFENITQTRTLENLRDTLLPKLMSGEVRVAA